MNMLPSFQADFSAESLDNLNRNQSSCFATDRDLRLVFTNQAWSDFALHNDGSKVLTDWPLGRALLECVPQVLLPYYESFYARVLVGEVCTHEYDCHSPERFRRFRMIAYPMLEGRYVFVDNTVLIERAAEGGVSLSDEQMRESYVREADGAVVQCAHCRRIRNQKRSEQWDFVPELVRAAIAPVSHGICLPCMEHYFPSTPNELQHASS